MILGITAILYRDMHRRQTATKPGDATLQLNGVS
jgi:hypothetical protein